METVFLVYVTEEDLDSESGENVYLLDVFSTQDKAIEARDSFNLRGDGEASIEERLLK